MIEGSVPTRAPAFPDVVTHAWIISSAGSLNRFRALRFRQDCAWEDFGVVEVPVQPD
jgi:hypothetical protein